MKRLDIMTSHLSLSLNGLVSLGLAVMSGHLPVRPRRPRPDCGRPIDCLDENWLSCEPEAWRSRSLMPPRCGPSRSRGGFMYCSARTARVPSRGPGPTGFGRSRFLPWTSRAGSRVNRCESTPGRDGFPGPLDELEPGRYAIQAVVRLNLDTHKIGDGEGNAYGPVVHAELDPKKGERSPSRSTTSVKPRPFKTTERIKLVELPSPKLSAFHHRPIKHRAAVILPKAIARRGTARPSCRRFTSSPGSAATTPWPRASRTALDSLSARISSGWCSIPTAAPAITSLPTAQPTALEARPWSKSSFPISRAHSRPSANPRARLLNGHSSGGWSSLWLQVTYPDFFGGTWSTSPDPVDFRDFQRINIYAAGENMFRDRAGKRRPIARMGAMPALYYDRFCRMDDVIGWGGQLGSFEAVFSPLDQNGQPAQALGPIHRRHRSRSRQGVGSLRHPARPRAKLAGARAQAQGQAPRHHGRHGHVLP